MGDEQLKVLKVEVKLLKETIESMRLWIHDIEMENVRMQRAFDALGRRLEGSERHPEDEGWFD